MFGEEWKQQRRIVQIHDAISYCVEIWTVGLGNVAAHTFPFLVLYERSLVVRLLTLKSVVVCYLTFAFCCYLLFVVARTFARGAATISWLSLSCLSHSLSSKL